MACRSTADVIQHQFSNINISHAAKAQVRATNYHMPNACIALQCSSSNPDVTAAILNLAGDLVKSEVRIRTAGKQSDKTHHIHSDTKEKKKGGGGRDMLRICDGGAAVFDRSVVKSQSQPTDFLLI